MKITGILFLLLISVPEFILQQGDDLTQAVAEVRKGLSKKRKIGSTEAPQTLKELRLEADVFSSYFDLPNSRCTTCV